MNNTTISVVISSTVTWEFDESEISAYPFTDSNFENYDDFRKQAREAFSSNLM